MNESELVLMADPRVAAIPVTDCGEPLVTLLDDNRFLIDPRKHDPADAYTRVRSGIVPALWIAEQYVRGHGLRLLIIEAYRPLSLQRTYFEKYRTQLRAEHPDWTAEHLRAMTSRYVSPPEIAPHSCGGALDVTLADASGTELDLGCRVNATPEESGGLCYTDAPGLAPSPRAYRRLLQSAMTEAGAVNYSCEWWHFEVGTRYAALKTGEPHARYGPLEAQ